MRAGNWTRARRLSWGVVAQAAASLTNLLLSAAGAKLLSVRDFGALASILAVMYIVQAIVRALCAEVYVAAYSASEQQGAARSAGRRAQSATITITMILAALVIVVATVAPLPYAVRDAAWVAAFTLLPMLWFDCRKLILIAQGQTRQVAMSNALALIAQAAGALLLWRLQIVSAWSLLLVFCAATSIGILLTHGAPSPVPSPAAAAHWMRDHIRLARTFLLEALSAAIAGQVVLVAVSVIVGLEATASIRAAMLLLAPLTFLVQALSQQAVAEVSRIRVEIRWRVSAMIFIGAALLSVGWSIVLATVPNDLIKMAFGSNGQAAAAAISGMTLYAGASLGSLGVSAMLRVGQATRVLTRIRLTILPFALCAPMLVGGLVGDAGAVAYAMGAINIITLLLLAAAAYSLGRSQLHATEVPSWQ